MQKETADSPQDHFSRTYGIEWTPKDPGASSPVIPIFLPPRVAGSLTVGRCEEVDICVDDRLMSRVHFEVSGMQGHWHLRDRVSRNGTKVNGRRLAAEPVLISDGDIVEAGVSVFEVVYRGQ